MGTLDPPLCRAVPVIVVLLWSSVLVAQAPATATATAEPDPAIAPESTDPAPEVQARYRDVTARAVAEYAAGHWAEARALFLSAHELWPSARTLRTLGMTSFELRAYAQALNELQAALAEPRRPLLEEQRAQVAALIEQARAFVGRYHVQLAPAGGELRVDGAPAVFDRDGALVLEVGRHELRARAPGYNEQSRVLDVRGREDEALALELSALPAAADSIAPAPTPTSAPPPALGAPAASRAHARVFTWVAAGTAVALAGTSLALWLKSDSDFDTQKQACEKMPRMGCEPGSIETAGIKDLQTAHQVTAVLAGVAGATAVALFFLEGGDESSASVAIGPAGVSARGRF